MDKLMEEIKEHRGVRDTTINIYKRHLNKLADEITGKDFSSTEFIKQKYGEIKKFLDSQTISKKKNYLAAILAAISPKGKKEPKKGFEKVYDKYVEELLSEHKKYTDKINTHTKNIKEDKNWIDWIKKYENQAERLRSLTDKRKQKKHLDEFIEKIYVDYDEDNKEHQLDIRLKLKLFDDDLIYKDVQNKKLGYEIKEGSNSKMLSFKRERNVKKKRTI